MHKVTFCPSPEQIIFSEHRKFLVADENTASFCLPLLPQLKDVPVIIIPSGESGKRLSNCELIWNFLASHHADRQAELLVLGGGVLCDMASFSASLYQRGMNCTLLPTSLLAMTDAAIGGKTGVNFNNLKNYLGTFQSGHEVIICTEFLKTLPDIECMNGWAEMLKHSLISGQESLQSCLNYIIHRQLIPDLGFLKQSIQCKLDLVTLDPHDYGIRKKLNLGHTIAHALEAVAMEKGKELSHGNAVFAGIWIELQIGSIMGFTSQNVISLLDPLWEKIEPVDFSDSEIPQLLEACIKDKKNAQGEIRMVIVRDVGQVDFDVPVSLVHVEIGLTAYIKHFLC